jgi:hypothetical protein
MALSTFAELKTSVQAWLKPNTTMPSPEVTLIDDYIRMAEAKFNRTLMHPLMEMEATLTITSGSAPVPAELLNVITIQLTQAPYRIITPSQAPLLAATAGYAGSNYPSEYKWLGETFKFDTPMSVSAAIRYRRTIPALSVSNTSNWLLSRFPDMYLFESVLNGDTRLLDDEQMTIINARNDRALDEFNDWARLSHAGVLKPRPSAGVV